MIRYLSHAAIDQDKWDAAIDASINGMVYAKSWYLNIVSPGWEALAEEDFSYVFPLTGRRKYGISYLYQPFFTQQLGVFGKEICSAQTLEAFAEAIPDHFRLVEIQLNHTNKFSAPGFKISERLTHHLNLKATYDEIQKGYSENLKRNLRRANQNAIGVATDFATVDLISLFRSNRGQDLSTLKETDYSNLEKLITEGSKRNLVTKLGIAPAGKLEAGALFLRSNNEYIFLFSATSAASKETGGMTLIIDHFIRNHCGENRLLDFEGSMDPGLARYYKSFGSKEVVYLQIRKNNLPLPIRWLK